MPSTNLEQERVCVFIDNNALFNAFVELGEQGRIDYKRLRKWLLSKQRRGPVRFYCGEIRNDSDLRRRFYQMLSQSGFEVFPSFQQGSRASVAPQDADLCRKVESQISCDMFDLLDAGYQTFVIVSGSSQLEEIAKTMVQKGVEVEISFFKDCCSPELLCCSSRFRELKAESIRLKNDFDIVALLP